MNNSFMFDNKATKKYPTNSLVQINTIKSTINSTPRSNNNLKINENGTTDSHVKLLLEYKK